MLSISVGPLASLGCVDLYNALIKLRPEWEAEILKVMMTGSAEDGPEWQKHIGNKKQLRGLANLLPHQPDLQEEAVKTVLAQAELLCAEWV